MSDSTRPEFYYLMKYGSNVKIERMTDQRAGELYDQGRRWLDIGKKTEEEALQALNAYPNFMLG